MLSQKLIEGLLKISGFYFILILTVFLTSNIFPSFIDYLPIGTAERIFSNIGTMELDSTAYAERLSEEGVTGHAIFFAICFLTALALAIPVGTVYLTTRQEKKKSDSLAKLIVVLPVAVTGLVLIVQNSLALAFGLAGIVAGGGVRFRTNMREFTDTLFFLISIGIGLSAGIGALGLALIMSAIFNYTILSLYAIGYGDFKVPLTENDTSPVLEELKEEDLI
ncbi:MAG: hypothetical protein AB3N63_12565 [Puniceicoccaceae bacterium]